MTWLKDIIYVGTKEIAEYTKPLVGGVATDKFSVTMCDHLGSPRFIWDGTTLTKQKFLPFGEQLPGLLGAPIPAKGFTNHEATDASGLIYAQARFYLPMWGRFASPDPGSDQHFEETQSWNIYSYCRNIPTTHTDPTGMWDGAMHTCITRILATAAGYDRARSRQLGDLAQAPDSTRPARSGFKNNPDNLKFHFPNSGDIAGLKGAVAGAGQGAAKDKAFGELVHSTQDSKSPVHGENNRGASGHAAETIAYGALGLGNPDSMQTFPGAALNAAEATSNLFNDMKGQLGQTSGESVSFDQIKGLLKDFIQNPGKNTNDIVKRSEAVMDKVEAMRKPNPEEKK